MTDSSNNIIVCHVEIVAYISEAQEKCYHEYKIVHILMGPPCQTQKYYSTILTFRTLVVDVKAYTKLIDTSDLTFQDEILSKLNYHAVLLSWQ